MALDATEILPDLWMGGAITDYAELEARFRCVVFAARELQPSEPDCSAIVRAGLEPLRVPLRDDGTLPTAEELASAVDMSKAIVRRVSLGKRVLVTCAQGRNRSGLLVALALHRLFGWSGAQCAELVKRRREGSLTNVSFLAALNALPRKEVAHV